MNSGVGLPVLVAAAVPVLFVRLGFTFVRMKAKRRGAVRRFRRELLRCGMRREYAERLSADYEEIGRLRSYMPGDLRIPLIG